MADNILPSPKEVAQRKLDNLKTRSRDEGVSIPYNELFDLYTEATPYTALRAFFDEVRGNKDGWTAIVRLVSWTQCAALAAVHFEADMRRQLDLRVRALEVLKASDLKREIESLKRHAVNLSTRLRKLEPKSRATAKTPSRMVRKVGRGR